MSRELDAAMGAAHALTKAPRVDGSPHAATTVPVKAGAPAVKVDKSRHRVRLRNIDHALEGCLAGDGPEQRFRLEPNAWTVVTDDVYSMLRDKFYKPQTMVVPDWNGDVNHPVHTPRVQETQEYILEFPDEME